MKTNYLFIAFVIAILGWGCSTEPDTKYTHISGVISVADSIDATGDFSGIGLTIFKPDSANSDADTLFHTVTDSSGTFSGMAIFEQKGRYPLLISRNQKNIARIGVILADEDSVEINGELPNLENTISISSREHQALDQYQRLNKGFQRVNRFIRAGKLKGDTLRQEIHKWSDLYWQVYQKDEGTIASELAARKSISLLQRLDNELMMKRIREVQTKDNLSDLGATYGKRYIADSRGLDPALSYLDSLANMTQSDPKSRRIAQEKIKLLYDSARIDAAKKKLKAFKKRYPNRSSEDWVKSITYDLNYLSPGDSIPDFQFTQNGNIISRDSLLGTPYILEITRLSNSLYQNQFDRTLVIHSIYKNYGLEVVTIPLDEKQVTVDAFFQERMKPWPVADAQAFDRQKLLKEFNIRLIPTRFLIDQEGNIVRKYVGKEFQDVIQDIQTVIKNKKEPT